MSSLPKALEAWEPELRHFAADLAPRLGELSTRLREALGALRASTVLPSDEPKGYGALARRGPFERLLASEWALQLEDPDEFIRRASSAEQLFLQLERASPAATLEAWLFFDCGPSQLGAPRLAHLAALIAFARRAREADTVLRWAPVRHAGPPHEELSREAITHWLFSRTAVTPSAADLSAWAARYPPAPGAQRDIWLVGGAPACALARQQGWSTLLVAEDDGRLRVELAPARRCLSLELPPPREQVRMLRDPFPAPVRAPPPPARRNSRTEAVRLHPRTQLAFSYDSHRLLARTDDGSITALPIRNTSRATQGWPSTARIPVGMQLVAAFWDSKRSHGLIVTKSDATWLTGWDGTLVSQLDGPHLAAPWEAVWRSALAPRRCWEQDKLLVVPREGSIDTAALALGRDLVALVPTGTNLQSEPHRAVIEPGGVQRAWLMINDRRVHAARDEGGAVEITSRVWHAEERRRATDEFPRISPDMLAGYEVHGVIGNFDVPGLLGVHSDRQQVAVLMHRKGEWKWEALLRARAPVEALAASNNGMRVAWRDANGEVGVYSRERADVLLRVRVTNAAETVP